MTAARAHHLHGGVPGTQPAGAVERGVGETAQGEGEERLVHRSAPSHDHCLKYYIKIKQKQGRVDADRSLVGPPGRGRRGAAGPARR
ncbi:hypothetical protein Lesp01_39420 [Lentzea sp. NBRC 102530]|nr:hypothetical protein Lesp01_39420 [Lentzea sp. NBRC 102530]